MIISAVATHQTSDILAFVIYTELTNLVVIIMNSQGAIEVLHYTCEGILIHFCENKIYLIHKIKLYNTNIYNYDY